MTTLHEYGIIIVSNGKHDGSRDTKGPKPMVKKTKATDLNTLIASLVKVSATTLGAIDAYKTESDNVDKAAIAWRDTVASTFGKFEYTKSPQGDKSAPIAHKEAYQAIIAGTFIARHSVELHAFITDTKQGAGAEMLFSGKLQTKKYIQQQKGQALKSLLDAVARAEKNIKTGKGANSRNKKANIETIADAMQKIFNIAELTAADKLDKTTDSKLRNRLAVVARELNKDYPKLGLKLSK
tara:strand:- start:321 stop:1037 length:717 start_codon:yes stop_codon:yes gene_type:complete